MLRALYERGIVPDMIVGASAGALNGAFIASRPQTPETADALGAVWRAVRRSTMFPLNPLIALGGLVGGRGHLVPDRGLRRLLETHLQFERLEDAAIPLHLVTVDALTGREIRLSTGPTLDAILASAAIPGVFPSVSWNGMQLIDGGVSDNTPIAHAIELGAQEVYVMPTVLPAGDPCALAEPPRGALGAVLHAMTLLVYSRLVTDIDAFRDRVKLIVLPPPCPIAIQPIDFSHADTLISEALEKSRAFLDRRAVSAHVA